MNTRDRKSRVLLPTLLPFFAATVALAAVLITPTAQADELEVGVVAIDTRPEIGVPLAGYGSSDRRMPKIDWDDKIPYCTFFRPSEGVHTPIRSKVMALRKGKKHLIFISLDVVGVEWRFVRDLAARLEPMGIRRKDLILSGTHTHSGPGTLSRKLPLELVAVDFFIQENYDRMLDKVFESVQLALAEAEPAELYETSFEAQGLQRNKFRHKDEEYYNKKASFLLARSKRTKNWLGGLVNFAVHGGGMPTDLLLYSSDFPGQIELNMEALLASKNVLSDRPPTMLFMNGAEGDVATPDRGVELIENLGREFARQAAPALEESRLKPVAGDFEVRTDRVWLGIPASSLKYCVGGIFKNSPIPLRVSLVPLFNQRADLTAIRIGHLTMLTWPGEPSTSLGWRLQAEAAKLGFPDAWMLGLVNDYMAYFTSKDEYFEGAYDSCSSLFNWRGGNRVIAKHKKILKKMKRP